MSAHRDSRRRTVRPLLALLGAAAVLAASPPPADAQAEMAARQDEFQQAQGEYIALFAEYQRVFNLHEQALDELADARREDDEARQQRAFRVFQSRARQVEDLELRVGEAAARLDRARRALLEALDDRELEILEQLDGMENPVIREALMEEWRQRRRQALELEGELDLEEAYLLRPVPELTVDPRDGPQDLRDKASFMETRAADYEAEIEHLDLEIARLERRVQTLRSREDLLSDLSRFDNDLVPGGRLGPRTAPGAAEEEPAPDSEEAMAMEGRTLPEQLEHLRGVRAQAVEFRGRALEQAEVFRALAEGRQP